MKTKIIFLALIISFTFVNNYSQNSPFVRYPAINSGGTEIAFSFQGDIWKVSVNGGHAIRLTVHEAYEKFPRWSPDDSQIAFSSNRWGNNDVYVINANGTGLKRITYHSADDEVSGWSQNNEILFTTRRTFRQVEWEKEIYAASPNGGTPVRILNALGYMPAKSPNGKYVAFVKGPCRLEREAYKGSANKEIWLYDIGNDKFTQLTTFEGQDFSPQWANDSTLYFISARNGVYNIFKMFLNGQMQNAGVEPVTDFKEDGIRYFTVSKNGRHIAFERGTDIYYLNLLNNAIHKVDIVVSTDYKFDPFEYKTFSNKINSYDVSPDGKYSVFEIHGEVFVTENDKEKKRTVNISNNAYRDEQPLWLNDSTVIFISDRNGQKDLYLASSGDKNETNIFKSLKIRIKRLTRTSADENNIALSPDKKKIAVTTGRGKLVVYNIAPDGKMTNPVVLLDGWATPGGVSWSPDSKWLAYSLEDLNFNSEIYIHKADGSMKPVNVSMHPRGDSQPVWSPDGSKLAFISDRNNRNNDVWFVWLRKSDWEKSKQDWEEENGEGKKSAKNKKGKKDSVKIKPVKIDFEKIWQRVEQVTNMPGSENSPLFSQDGKTIYFVTSEPATKGTDLYKIKFDGTKIERITKGGKNPSALSLTQDGKYIFMLTKGGKLNRLKESQKKTGAIALSAKMKIDYKTELNQMFEEAWRTLRDGFYDPDFHGKDWDALKRKYKPMALNASTKTDFRDMFNIMLGQLNASHMGMYGKDREKVQSEKTGLLGIEIYPEEKGIKVLRVVPKTPADREASKINAGDIILSVNGEPVNKKNNFYKPLANTANEKVLLEVLTKNGKKKNIAIRPASSISSQLYDEWVESKRNLVNKLSNGKLGYLHIKAMGWVSFERFERELAAAGYGKDAIVIDVRYNGGGWTTDYLMVVLNYKQHAYTVPRGAAKNLQKEHLKFRENYPFAERLPYAVWTKPSVALCNESSYSNAEIFSHAYQTLGIGKLVGVPSFGAVISTGGKRLIDGSLVRLPFRAWYVKATDENMEFKPAVPDYIVKNSPDSKAKGKDEQLHKAVEVLMGQLK